MKNQLLIALCVLTTNFAHAASADWNCTVVFNDIAQKRPVVVIVPVISSQNHEVQLLKACAYIGFPSYTSQDAVTCEKTIQRGAYSCGSNQSAMILGI